MSTVDIQLVQHVFRRLHPDNPFSIYWQILKCLQKLPIGNKWMNTVSCDMMHHLSSTTTISKMQVKELNTVSSAVKDFTGQNLFVKSKLKKLEKVNVLNRLFGNGIDCKPKQVQVSTSPGTSSHK